jgi:hypothetical protein
LEAGFYIWIEFKGTGWTTDLRQAFEDERMADWSTSTNRV